ncbi:MAG: polysaccharide biosynthesis/export family protein [Bacteroidota bacterium]|nr:polysaccharide biosynthesis/export family protein [Bacteroidota bacterium]
MKQHSSYFGLACLMLCTSCAPVKNTTYFQNLQKDTTLHNLVSKDFETKIRKSDLLSISIASMSPDVAFYNAPQNSLGTLGGYLVDENGNIPFLKLGTLHVEGLTKKELKVKLEHDLVPYLKDVIVSVGIFNRHLTMIGAAGPQVLPITIENMTILDALAISGDIGQKGRTDNILVIREKEDGKEFKRLNLTDNSIFYSPYYYVHPNDIVYVEPVKVKSTNTAQIISYITAGVSFALLIVNQVLKL